MAAERKAPSGIIGGEALKTDWQTPEHLLEAVRDYFGGAIPFDAATYTNNPTRADRFCAVEDPPAAGAGLFGELGAGGEHAGDGLAIDWPEDVWVNPPYGKALKLWLAKIVHEAKSYPYSQVVALLPCSRWEQAYMQDALEHANAVCWIRKRVKFINPATGDAVGGNTYANAFFGWNVDAERFAASFAHLGLCQELFTLDRRSK